MIMGSRIQCSRHTPSGQNEEEAVFTAPFTLKFVLFQYFSEPEAEIQVLKCFMAGKLN
jgi:hypothetical protein